MGFWFPRVRVHDGRVEVAGSRQLEKQLRELMSQNTNRKQRANTK